MTNQKTGVEAPIPPCRARTSIAVAPSAATQMGLECPEKPVASSSTYAIAARFGINVREDIERLRKSGEDFAWRRWKPFHG